MNLSDWKLHSLGSDGRSVVIDDVELPWDGWERLDDGPLNVPHPQYPHQRHALDSYEVEVSGKTIRFCAGELSNGAWCIYVPVRSEISPPRVRRLARWFAWLDEFMKSKRARG